MNAGKQVAKKPADDAMLEAVLSNFGKGRAAVTMRLLNLTLDKEKMRSLLSSMPLLTEDWGNKDAVWDQRMQYDVQLTFENLAKDLDEGRKTEFSSFFAEFLRDQSLNVRVNAACLLYIADEHPDIFVPGLLKMASEDDACAKAGAVRAIGSIWGKKLEGFAGSVVPLLQERLRDSSPEVRQEAGIALSEIASASIEAVKPALDSIKRALREEKDEGAQWGCLSAVSNIARQKKDWVEEMVPRLWEIAAEYSSKNAEWAFYSICHIAGKDYAKKSSYFAHRYKDTIADEAQVANEQINTYYMSIEREALRFMRDSNQVKQFFCTPDVSLAEKYLRAEVKVRYKPDVLQRSNGEFILVFDKAALMRDYKITEGEGHVNENAIAGGNIDMQYNKGYSELPKGGIPFTKKYIKEVIAYSDADYDLAKLWLKGTGIKVTRMGPARYEEFLATDKYLPKN